MGGHLADISAVLRWNKYDKVASDCVELLLKIDNSDDSAETIH